MGFRQILAVGAFPLEQVGHRIQPHAIHSKSEPVIQDAQDLPADPRVVIVQIGLMAVEPVPVICLCNTVPGPVGVLEVREDDAGILVLVRRVAPDVVVAQRRAGIRPPRLLKPFVLIRRVIDDQLRDHADIPPVRLPQELSEIRQGAVLGVDVEIVGDVIAVVKQRRWVERQQPQGGHPQIADVVQLPDQALEVADAVAGAVVKRFHVQLVDDRVFVPERLIGLCLRIRHVGLLAFT